MKFNIAIEEAFSVTFTIDADTQEEAEAMAREMAEQQAFPPEAKEYADREVRVWKETK
jgi:hypothetical protein